MAYTFKFYDKVRECEIYQTKKYCYRFNFVDDSIERQPICELATKQDWCQVAYWSTYLGIWVSIQ